MNKLLKITFDRYGYDGPFLNNILGTEYGGDYLFRDEGGLILALEDIRKSRGKIVVFPDFDMDGISAGAILYAGLSLLGFDAEIYAPDVSKGYGITKRDIDKALKAWPDMRAMITCDVGIDCHSAIAYAKSKGLTAFVTDHHPENPERRVPADFIVDPCRSERDCPFEGVCGAYVAYHVMTTYARLTGNEAIIALMSKLSIFAALGSCGDLMPVIHDTRKAILDGIREFNSLLDHDDAYGYLSCSPESLPDAYAAVFENLRALHYYLLRAGMARPGDVTHTTLGFTYCPMFNSVKRMQGSMTELYALLYTRNNGRVGELAEWLAGLNKARKALTASEFAKMLDGAYSGHGCEPYLYAVDCVPGICGLLAMKMSEASGMPCIVTCRAGRRYSGSGRVPDGIPRKLLEYPGVEISGHEGAFGISIDASMFDAYADYLRLALDSFAEASRDAEPSEPVPDPSPVVRIGEGAGDCDFRVSSLEAYDECFGYAAEIDGLRPFGRGFEEPEHILAFGPEDIMEVRTMGAGNEHLKASLRFNIQMVLFGGTSRYLEDLSHCGDPGRIFRLRGRFSINEYNGSTSLQFVASGWAS